MCNRKLLHIGLEKIENPNFLGLCRFLCNIWAISDDFHRLDVSKKSKLKKKQVKQYSFLKTMLLRFALSNASE